MIKQNLKIDYVFDLINAFKSLNSEEESILFLQDILTASEIKKLSLRLRIARLLLDEKKQRDISITLNVSIATVSKVNSWINQKSQGFKKVISRLPIKYSLPTKISKGPLEFHLPEILLTSVQYSIANSQNKKAGSLIESIRMKESSDKLQREVSDDIYKSRKV